MSLRLRCGFGFLCGLITLFSNGCVTKRTVTRDGAVVAQGYVMKSPLGDGSQSY